LALHVGACFWHEQQIQKTAQTLIDVFGASAVEKRTAYIPAYGAEWAFFFAKKLKSLYNDEAE
jgi:spermidine synthase